MEWQQRAEAAEKENFGLRKELGDHLRRADAQRQQQGGQQGGQLDGNGGREQLASLQRALAEERQRFARVEEVQERAVTSLEGSLEGAEQRMTQWKERAENLEGQLAKERALADQREQELINTFGQGMDGTSGGGGGGASGSSGSSFSAAKERELLGLRETVSEQSDKVEVLISEIMTLREAAAEGANHAAGGGGHGLHPLAAALAGGAREHMSAEEMAATLAGGTADSASAGGAAAAGLSTPPRSSRSPRSPRSPGQGGQEELVHLSTIRAQILDLETALQVALRGKAEGDERIFKLEEEVAVQRARSSRSLARGMRGGRAVPDMGDDSDSSDGGGARGGVVPNAVNAKMNDECHRLQDHVAALEESNTAADARALQAEALAMDLSRRLEASLTGGANAGRGVMTGAGQTWVTDENGAVVPGSVVEGGSNEAALASALAATQETLQSVRKELLLTETRLVEARTEEDARAEKIEATRTKPLEGTYGLKKRRGSGSGSGGGNGGGKVGGIGRGSDTLEAHAEDLVTRLQQVERVVEDQALALVELRQREVRSGIEHRVKMGEVRRHKKSCLLPTVCVCTLYLY